MRVTQLIETVDLHFIGDDIVMTHIEALIIKRYQGYTVTKARGYWEEGENFHKDDINIISFSGINIPNFFIVSLLKFIFENTDEKAVYYKRNGQAFIAER